MNQLPDSILLKIFHLVFRNSEDLLQEIPNVMDVCNRWRQIIKSAAPIRPAGLEYCHYEVSRKFEAFFKLLITSRDDYLDDVESLGITTFSNERINDAYSILDVLTMNKPKMLFLEIIHWKTYELHRIISSCSKLKHLDIYIDDEFEHKLDSAFAKLLRLSCETLETMELVIDTKSICDYLFDAVTCNSYPNMKTLIIGDTSRDMPKSKVALDVSELDKAMPNLKRLVILTLFVKKKPESGTSGFNKLQELILNSVKDEKGIKLNEIFVYLSYGSKHLKELAVLEVDVSPHLMMKIPAESIEDLAMANFYRYQRNSHDKIIARFAKTLTELTLYSVICPKSIRECFKVLIGKSGQCKLKCLTLHDSAAKPTDLLKFIHQAKFLEKVSLYGNKYLKLADGSYSDVNKLKNLLLDVICNTKNVNRMSK